MKFLIKQLLKFVGISGAGWCIDFILYSIFVLVLGWPVFISNCVSAIPAVSLVFLVSTIKIFQKSEGRLPVQIKYVLYLTYQFCLLILISLLGQWLASMISYRINGVINAASVKILVKLVITPITMLLNFCVMKILSEKL